MEVSSLSPSLVEKYAFLKPVTLDEAIKLKVCGVHISAMAEEHINELTLES